LFAVLAPGGQSGNFWIHPRIVKVTNLLFLIFWLLHAESVVRDVVGYFVFKMSKDSVLAYFVVTV
jgi:hypothetical protein